MICKAINNVDWWLFCFELWINFKIFKSRCLTNLIELLNHIFFFLALVKKYHQVIQRYYVQYLSGYDVVLLNQLIQVISLRLKIFFTLNLLEKLPVNFVRKQQQQKLGTVSKLYKEVHLIILTKWVYLFVSLKSLEIKSRP